MQEYVKSGKEILDDFFTNISKINNVDKKLAEALRKLYQEDKLTENSVKNEFQRLRDKNDNKNK